MWTAPWWESEVAAAVMVSLGIAGLGAEKPSAMRGLLVAAPTPSWCGLNGSPSLTKSGGNIRKSVEASNSLGRWAGGVLTRWRGQAGQIHRLPAAQGLQDSIKAL